MSARTVSVLRTHDDRLVPVAGVYEIDGAHTSVEFVGRHLMITKVRGRFSDVRGRITIAEEPEDSHVEAEIGTASLSTGNDDRDAHLEAATSSTSSATRPSPSGRPSVQAARDSTWEVVGDLTVRGTTRPVTLQVDFDGADVSPIGDERVGFSAATEVDREDFGLTWNMALETGGLLVGKTARIELNVEAVAATRKPPSPDRVCCSPERRRFAMPAITVDDTLVLPRIPRPDPTASRPRPVAKVVTAQRAIEGAGFSIRRPFPGGLSIRRIRSVPAARPRAAPRSTRPKRRRARPGTPTAASRPSATSSTARSPTTTPTAAAG